MLEQRGERIRFGLCGDGRTYEAVRGLSEQLGGRNVEFAPRCWVERLAKLIACSHLCLGLFGTNAKALRVIPNKVFDALACGRPLIALRVGVMIGGASVPRWVGCEEIRRLRKENYELRRANEILKSAPLFAARELDPDRSKGAATSTSRGRFGVEPICRTLRVSASAYYQRRKGEHSQRAVEDERLVGRIREPCGQPLRVRLPALS